MTVDERIERLAKRHAALAESVEMLRDRTAETAANLERQAKNLDDLRTTVDHLSISVDHLSGKMHQLMQVTQLNFDRLTKAMMGLRDHAGSC